MSLRPIISKTDVPLGWVVAPLSDFVLSQAGNSKLIKGKLSSSPGANLFQGFSASGQNVWADTYEHDETAVVVSAVGARCGKAFLARGKWVAIANTHVIIPEHQGIDSRFLWYGLNDEEFWIKSGSAQPFVVVSKSLAREFALPPKAEQIRIVEKLEELFSDLEAGVAELKAAQKKLVQFRQSLLIAAVEGTLSAEWNASGNAVRAEQVYHESDEGRTDGYESGIQLLSRILTERRDRWEAKQLAKFEEQGNIPPNSCPERGRGGWQDKYPEPALPDTIGLPILPEGWVWASMDMLTEIQGGIQKQPSRAPVANKFPFLRVANVARGQLKLEEIHEIELFSGELARFALQKGDLLIVEGNGSLAEIGRCALWDGSIENAVHQNHLIRARPVLMQPEFIEAWLNSLHGIEKLTKLAATTSGLYTLSVGKISRIPVPVPPLEEQENTVRILKAALEEQMRQQVAIAHSLKQSTSQRKNILKAAFSGQLVPQDPNGEPASVLLERIRSERILREKQPKTKKLQKSKGMKKSDLDSLRDWIASQPGEATFNYSELQSGLFGDYEALKDSLFQLLAEDKPIIEQIFDREAGSLQFRRVNA